MIIYKLNLKFLGKLLAYLDSKPMTHTDYIFNKLKESRLENVYIDQLLIDAINSFFMNYVPRCESNIWIQDFKDNLESYEVNNKEELETDKEELKTDKEEEDIKV